MPQAARNIYVSAASADAGESARTSAGTSDQAAWGVIDMGHDAQDAADLKDIGE